MEARKITVVQTKGNGKVVFMSEAETLGQLKKDFRSNNISYDGMTIYEGVSRTTLLDDATILPKDLPYKDVITNELVIMLTVANKKIKSGMDRKEAAEIIKKNNLGDAVKKQFNGRNWTQVSTDDLVSFVEKNQGKKDTNTTTAPVEKTKKKVGNAAKVEALNKEAENIPTVKVCKCKQVLIDLLELLFDNDCIDEDEKDEFLETLESTDSEEVVAQVAQEVSTKVVEKKEALKSSFSDGDIDNMLKLTK